MHPLSHSSYSSHASDSSQHSSICRIQCGTLLYYTCRQLPVRHAFTTRWGGVSTGHCATLNLGFQRGDAVENVRENYRRLAAALQLNPQRMTLTNQVHKTDVTVVTEDVVGTGLARLMTWETDALITALPDTPLCGFYADCVVTLFYDPATQTAGVAHAGWRGMAGGILPKTVDAMAEQLGAHRDSLIAVLGPSIRQECFETDADVPTAMQQQLGEMVEPFIQPKGSKFHVDLQGIGVALLQKAGVGTVIDSGLCTKCRPDEFWSHRQTNGVRGVQCGVICL